MKKAVKIIISVLVCTVLAAGIAAGAFLLSYTPSLTADFSAKEGEVSSRASGYLYGLAEAGVPSENMTESLDISSVSQKVAGGLQHPIGDIDNVYTQLENTDYDVVYLQDAYSTWYYNHDNINKMRSEGTYDWREFLEKDYLPKVEAEVKYLTKSPYADKVVYCLYNECDNGLWFGETIEDDSEQGFWCAYNEVGESNFFDAWKITYDCVREINPNALIGGPGFCDYDSGEIGRFLTFCVDNDCVPDVMIYHELNDFSIRYWQQHVTEYRAMERELQLEELPIIVTEYGRMCDCGMPGKMVQYITQIERSGVYGNVAYWRLADNLCDTAADDNMPNSNWWLYRWYADMEGSLISSEYRDLFNSNFENAYIKKKEALSSWGFMGIVSMTESEDRIDIICGGGDGDVKVKLKNLDDTALKGENVGITVEEAVYRGLTGEVTSPERISYECKSLSSSETIKIKNTDGANAYHIVIEKTDNKPDKYISENRSERFEFEDGELLGNAYTYDSAYATSGEVEGMVGGMENGGDGVKLTFKVPSEGEYDLDIIYGNANDGAWDENGRQNPDDRTTAKVLMTLDGEQTEIALDNTIKSEFTNCYTLENVELSEDEHTITFEHGEGTYVLDSMTVHKSLDYKECAVLFDSDRSGDGNYAFVAVAPKDSYYSIFADCETVAVNGNKVSLNPDGAYYLMRGLNYLEFEYKYDEKPTVNVEPADGENSAVLDVSKATLTAGAVSAYSETLDAYCIDGISSEGGSAKYAVNLDEQGVYAFTVCYSNNEEGGFHDYNVDLIERYITVDINGEKREVYCRNTYDWGKFKTVTFYAELSAGENELTLSNDGAVKFNGRTAYAPMIYTITVSKIAI